MTPKKISENFSNTNGGMVSQFFTDANLAVFITGMDERAPRSQSARFLWMYMGV